MSGAADGLTGLSQEEAERRLREHGPNEIPRQGRRHLGAITLGILTEPMFALLIGASVLYLLIGELADALVLSLFASLSVVIALVQEGRSERVLESLQNLASPRALVVRDGAQRRVAGRDLVVGDVLLLVEGDRIAADAELLACHDMLVDESLLTGESLPVAKRARSGDTDAQSLQITPDTRVQSGTLLVRGNGVGRVVATGAASEIGRIGAVLGSRTLERPRLQADTRRLVLVSGALGVAVSATAVLLYGFLRHDWLQALLAGIALGMSMLPEEFPLVVTVFTVMGAWRLSRSRVLTRRPAAIEALGTATVLCADKTGTLTQNRMAVMELRTARESWTGSPGDDAPTALSPALQAVLATAALASRADGGDPMERAIDSLLRDQSLAAAGSTSLREYPLRDEQRYVARAWRDQDGSVQLVAKGAPEAIAALCAAGAGVPEIAALESQAEAMAARGLRVLGVARARLPPGAAPPETAQSPDWQLLGLLGLADPLRAGVTEAVRECREAGIRVVMITGDYPGTARAIAGAAGIDAARLLSGAEIEVLDDVALRRSVRDVSVYARIAPLQKLRIVEAFKANGEIVAMTGDGVNDAPSLQAAHIGIAMGGRGTDVAREAASLVLLDDDFASVVRALRLGRRIYDNLRKAMAYILAVHLPIAGLALLPLLLGWPLLMTPMLIAMLELIIDPTCSIVFEAEAGEDDVMRRPPRAAGSAVLTAPLVGWGLLQGALALATVTAVVVWSTAQGHDAAQVRLMGWIGLIGVNVALLLTNRRLDSLASATLARADAVLWWGMGLTAALALLTTAVPGVRRLLSLALPPGQAWLLPIAAALLLLALLQPVKRLWSAALRS